MDGPVDPGGRRRGAGAAASAPRDVLHAPSRAVAGAGAPALVMTYWNPVERYGVDALRRRPRRRRRRRADHARPHPRRGAPTGSPPPTRTASTGSSSSRRRSTDERLAQTVEACRGLRLRRLDDGRHRRARRRSAPRPRTLVARTRARRRDQHVCVGLGVSTGDAGRRGRRRTPTASSSARRSSRALLDGGRRRRRGAPALARPGGTASCRGRPSR